MGFFDNLLKKGAKDLLNNLVDEATDRISDALDDKKTTTSSSLPVTLRVKNALQELYPQCTVSENVSPHTIGGEGNFRPYTYGLYLNNEPKAFIMVTDHNKEILRTFRWSKEQAEKKGIPFINFLTQFPNTEEYIKNRLSENIKL